MGAVKQVRVLGMDLAVRTDGLVGRERLAFAEYHPGAGEIVLDDKLAPQKQGMSLVHEVVEAVNAKLDLDLSHPAISSLATGVYAFLRDNPEAVRRILAGREIV